MNYSSRPLVPVVLGTLFMTMSAAAATLPTGSILINNGAASTAAATVTLNLSATDAGGTGLLSMRFRNSDCRTL